MKVVCSAACGTESVVVARRREGQSLKESKSPTAAGCCAELRTTVTRYGFEVASFLSLDPGWNERMELRMGEEEFRERSQWTISDRPENNSGKSKL